MMARFVLGCILVRVSLSVTQALASECVSAMPSNVEDCSHEVFRRSAGWNTKSICNITAETNNDDICMNKTICHKHFRLSVFDQQLFAITMKNTVIKMLTRCCKFCAKCSVNEIEGATYVNASILNSSDIIFPVLGDSTLNKQHGFYFLPSYKVPSSYYFTLKKSNDVIIQELIMSCLQLWPLFVLCLLFALISGFIVWVMETHLNREEFPRRFYVGLFDGFWWSFISMTTVGFGDKVPKSYLGRIYAIFWILGGITICSMLTASLTSEIIKAKSPADTDMKGKDVAVLKGRLHDIAVVAHQGGILQICQNGHTMRGIDEMIIRLKNRSIHGFLIDRNTYFHFTNRIHEKKYRYIAKRIRNIDMIKTEKFRAEKSLSCGMMLRDPDDYKYFKAYFDNNRLLLRSCNSLRMNTKQAKVDGDTNIFSPDSDLFMTVMYYSVVLLGIMVAVGILCEGRRYYISIKSN